MPRLFDPTGWSIFSSEVEVGAIPTGGRARGLRPSRELARGLRPSRGLVGRVGTGARVPGVGGVGGAGGGSGGRWGQYGGQSTRRSPHAMPPNHRHPPPILPVHNDLAPCLDPPRQALCLTLAGFVQSTVDGIARLRLLLVGVLKLHPVARPGGEARLHRCERGCGVCRHAAAREVRSHRRQRPPPGPEASPTVAGSSYFLSSAADDGIRIHPHAEPRSIGADHPRIIKRRAPSTARSQPPRSTQQGAVREQRRHA